jgi:P27 family predicted phage terminase small subunit
MPNPALPVETKRAKGTLEKSRSPGAAVPRVSEPPKPPEWLDGHGLYCWNRTAEILFARGQFSADSEVSLIALCQTYAEWAELAEDLRANGRFQKVRTYGSGDDEEGTVMERARPSLSAFQDCDRRLKGWLIEFGLTDASRGKVSGAAAPKDGEDPLAKYGLN